MTSKDPKAWYERGRYDATHTQFHSNRRSLKDFLQYGMQHMIKQYPRLQAAELWKTIEKLNEQRLEAEPDYTVYPELKGMKECYREQQRGFMEAAQCTRAEAAFYYNWQWFERRRLHTRYALGRPIDNADGCTAVFFRNSDEGPLLGRNNDFALTSVGIPRMPDWNCLVHSPIASCALCDEEPREIFPAEPFELMPDEIKGDIRQVVDFLKRYNEFWGPCNTLVVDKNQNAAAIEKFNCRMSVTWPKNGACYVTSFGYQDPDMQAHKVACDRKYMKAAGIAEDSPDWAFWRGCDRRLAHLAKLVDEETRKGPTLAGLARIMTEHEAPFPDRICLAGEPANTGLWSVASFSCVMTGKNRRMLFWRVEDGKPAYANPPYLIPGDGVKAKAAWKQGTRPPPKGEAFSDTVITIQRY